jgi:hypothetical protein
MALSAYQISGASDSEKTEEGKTSISIASLV